MLDRGEYSSVVGLTLLAFEEAGLNGENTTSEVKVCLIQRGY